MTKTEKRQQNELKEHLVHIEGSNMCCSIEQRRVSKQMSKKKVTEPKSNKEQLERNMFTRTV